MNIKKDLEISRLISISQVFRNIKIVKNRFSIEIISNFTSLKSKTFYIN
jgi:hypothetical protein